MTPRDLNIVIALAGIIILLISIPIIRKILDRKLIKSVTTLRRGTKSERDLVLRLLKRKIPALTIFHDLVIENYNGTYSQIDLAIATTEGIIVIEVKDMKGWIYGDSKYTNWTQVLNHGKNKYKFYNPIKQNQGHIKKLRSQLKQFQKIPFFSIIVFYGECELKEINYVPRNTYLVKSNRIFKALKKIRKENPPAPYINKRQAIDTLQQLVKNGEDESYLESHKANIKDMVGKDRIFN